MILSSSLLVTITTGTFGAISLICDSVSNPVKPGIFSSRKIISNDCSLQQSMASCPLTTGTTSYPLSCKNKICGFNKSISSSAQSTLSFFAAISLPSLFTNIWIILHITTKETGCFVYSKGNLFQFLQIKKSKKHVREFPKTYACFFKASRNTTNR